LKSAASAAVTLRAASAAPATTKPLVFIPFPRFPVKSPFAGDKRSNRNANSEIAKHQVEREGESPAIIDCASVHTAIDGNANDTRGAFEIYKISFLSMTYIVFQVAKLM
jgi:hypothetical protein